MSDEAKTAVVRLMVEHDPGFVHAVTFNDETALHFACSCDLIQAVCTLLDSGADINRIDMSGQSPLFYATNPNVVELLLSRGADVHNMDATGRTPLHDAVAMAREDIARLLIEHGADVRAQSMDGMLKNEVSTRRDNAPARGSSKVRPGDHQAACAQGCRRPRTACQRRDTIARRSMQQDNRRRSCGVSPPARCGHQLHRPLRAHTLDQGRPTWHRASSERASSQRCLCPPPLRHLHSFGMGEDEWPPWGGSDA
eukprot:TRINITY_DN25869_c0_g1_i4.p1 TRINITY_DN25869_c0_g1~~TRINITY_DN25869_c0_g1_i4.p1  ORF type:complete len:294 (+),score=26.26 TRINITY_DN25869_c0_g1_i4:122-883(+)